MGYVEGFTSEIQQRLLGIAADLGLSPAAVQPNTSSGANGWNVPDSVSDAYAAGLVEAAAPKKRPAKKAAPKAASSDPETDQE